MVQELSEKKKYRPLNMFTAQTDELKKLIAEHQDLPIVVIVSSDVVADDDYAWWYAPDIRFTMGEILDCEQDVNDEKTYIDRDDFEEDLRNIMSDQEEYENATDEEFDKAVEEELKIFEPYWKQVIQIRADV